MDVEMKNPFISLLIIGLLLSASLGLVMMKHMNEEGHVVCPFDLVGATSCAQFRNSFDFIASHLNAFSRFISAIPASSFTVYFYLLLLLILSLPVILKRDLRVLKLKTTPGKTWFYESFIPTFQELRMYWFALHENSPAIS